MYKHKKRHRLIALGGTFDHLHEGHKSFIKYAGKMAKKVLIGITSDSFPHKKKHSESLQPLRTRLRAVVSFCKQNNISHEIHVLNDPFGPTIDKDFKGIDALCVTQETLANGEKINEIRSASGMRELPIYIAPMVASDSGDSISAEKIRSGEINNQGEVYLENIKNDININDQQRQYFSKPMGPIVTEPKDNHPSLVAVVGDYALNEFIENNWHYDIGIYDNKTQRQHKIFKNLEDIKPNFIVNNPAGSITLELLQTLSKLDLEQKNHILIEGEEDLATAGLILTLPLLSTIYYGQPGKGMVTLNLTDQFKNKIFKTLTSY